MQRATPLAFALLAPVAAFAQEHAETHDAAAHAGPAMPQLNTATYPSQIFWLLVTGVLMYLIMSKLALPRVARMVDMRDDQVRRNLETASRLRHEIEDMQAVYTRALRDADEKAKTVLDRAIQEAKAKHDKANADIALRINQKMTETEAFLRGEKEVLMGQVPAMSDRLSAAVLQQLGKKSA